MEGENADHIIAGESIFLFMTWLFQNFVSFNPAELK